MKPDVLAAGELYVDLILGGFDAWPQPGQEAFAREFRREIGGGAAITACGLATLGTSTGVFGVVGADHQEWIVNGLRQHGVETEGIMVDAVEPTGFTVAVTTPRDRALFSYPGANRRFPEALAKAARSLAARHVHLACAPDWSTAGELFDAIHGTGCTLSLDAGWHEAWLADPRALEALSKVDLFFPNEAEAARITGEAETERMLRRFAEAGVKNVALKLGAKGAALLCKGDIRFAEPLAVTPRDTTGAGDCFDAGFLHAWLKAESPEACLSTANLCGALSCEAYGGIAGFPSRERLERLSCKR
jgi:ribokinase